MKASKSIFLILTITLSTLLWTSCVDSYMGIEQVKTELDSPAELTINRVVPKSGALEIHFSLPKGDPTISQVVASYVNDQGNEIDFNVSRYSSYILVEGFTGTSEVTVELYCIDTSGNKSEKVVVKESPLISPVEIALSTMRVEPAFGGIKVEWDNYNADPFVIHVLSEDTIQKGISTMVEDLNKAIYSTDSTNTFAYVRPYNSVEQKFGFIVSDKWGNRTDTLFSSLTPYKEELIDYNHVKGVTYFNPSYKTGVRDYATFGVNPETGIQNDGVSHSANFDQQTMFDGIKPGNGYLAYKYMMNLSDPDPANRYLINDVYQTFDLNMDVRLSRVKIFPRTGLSYTYTRSSVKRFRIWGTDDSNSDRWSKFPEGWTLIGEYVGVEPADRSNLTQEERDYFNNNQEYTISEGNVNPEAKPTTSFRYMRLQFMEAYVPETTFYTVNEFEMYGDIEKIY